MRARVVGSNFFQRQWNGALLRDRWKGFDRPVSAEVAVAMVIGSDHQKKAHMKMKTSWKPSRDIEMEAVLRLDSQFSILGILLMRVRERRTTGRILSRLKDRRKRLSYSFALAVRGV